MAARAIIRKFHAFDKDGDGVIDAQEMGRVLKHIDPTLWTDEKIAKLFRVLDVNSDGCVDYNEFSLWAFGSPGVVTRDLHSFRVAVTKAKPPHKSRPHSRSGAHHDDSSASVEHSSTPCKQLDHDEGPGGAHLDDSSASVEHSGTPCKQLDHEEGVSSAPVEDAQSLMQKVVSDHTVDASASTSSAQHMDFCGAEREGAPQIQVVATLLSGHSARVVLPNDALVKDLRGAIERELAVPSRQQKLLLGDAALPPASTLREAKLEEGSQVTVLQMSTPPLPKLPQTFRLEMLTSRDRTDKNPRYPARFIQLYEIDFDLVSSCVRACLLRRDDSDKVNIDGHQGRRHGESGHWSSGSRPFESSCDKFDLTELLRIWMERSEPVLEAGQCIWTEAGADGRFQMPSPDCVELHVDAPMKFWPACRDLRLLRVLVDSSGWPTYAALYDEELGRMHFRIRRGQALSQSALELRDAGVLQEFDLTLRFPETS